MYTLGAGRILIKSIIIVYFFNLMAWKASWAHRTGENKKKDNDKIKIKKSVQTSSACGILWSCRMNALLKSNERTTKRVLKYALNPALNKGSAKL